MKHLALMFVTASCAACLPLSQRYYVPSAEGARVVSTTCDPGPPYAANLTGEGFSLSVFLERSALTITVFASKGATITLDPMQIQVEAAGQPIAVESVRYTPSPDAKSYQPALVPLEVNTGFVQVVIALGLQGWQEVVAHLPTITVNGTPIRPMAVSFHPERHTHLRMIVGNC